MDYKHSIFYYGHIVRSETSKVPFRENGELTDRVGTLQLGAYTLSEYATEIARAMTEAGTQAYAVTVNRTTRKLTISAPIAFILKFVSNIEAGNSIRTTAGFISVDTSNLTSHTGLNATGSVYTPMAPINKYTPFEHWRGASEASINVAASGRSTVISFGDIQRMRCNISAITNKQFALTSIISNNPTAKEEALAFLEYITQKNPVEFMYDKLATNTFTKCILESTKDSKSGTSFELYEGLGKGLRDVYETDILVFRRMD